MPRPPHLPPRPRPSPPPGADGADRLFLAVWPGPPEQAALGRWLRGWSWPRGAAVVAPGRLHLTLHFIGDVPRARLPELRRRLAVPVPRCAIGFERVEQWPRGLVALVPQAPPPALAELHAALADALRALDLPVERRPFRPHLTLARRAAGAVPPPEVPALPWSLCGYRLVRSAGGYFPVQHYGDDAPAAAADDPEETPR